MRVHFLFLSARQANPYPHGFSMHTEDIMPFLHVNRRAWKQTHWISGAFLFYILINLKAVIKSSFVWDVPCANAYLVPNSPLPVFLYKYKQNNLKKKPIRQFSVSSCYKFLDITNMGKLPYFFLLLYSQEAFQCSAGRENQSGFPCGFDKRWWEGMRSKGDFHPNSL